MFQFLAYLVPCRIGGPDVDLERAIIYAVVTNEAHGCRVGFDVEHVLKEKTITVQKK